MFYLGIALLLASALANPVYDISVYDDATDDYGGYRLPGTQIPSNYKLDIVVLKEVFENKQNTFDGTVEITFTVTEESDSIKLHAPSNKISKVGLKNDKADVKIEDYSAFNKTSSILTITLASKLVVKTNYILTISYTGDIDSKSMYGLYRSSFINEKNETEYLLATQFEPVSARQAFPCFDEPKFKATFDISITYPKGYSALSNTPLIGDPAKIGTDQLKATFKTTPKISTYLIAFVVSHFTCSQGANVDANVVHQVCSRDESSDNRELATLWGSMILNAFEQYTGILYNQSGMLKMDQVAIPDFGAGAMENWGLVTYRERLILYDENESSNVHKQSIITVMAHEFTHQWFGDLVTCNWWNDIFLNEGFAAYFQYFILSELKQSSSWEFDKQFIVDQLQPVLVDDAAASSKALTAKAATPEEVNAKFDTIAYNKGASVIRMMENIIGSENFKKGLNSYLQKKSLSNAVPSDLLNAFEEFAPKANLPTGTTLTKVMENWFNLPGYPVVTVTQRGMDISVKQNRFLFDKSDSTKSTWNIPISYTVSTDKNEVDSAPKAWLTASTTSIKKVFQNTTGWVVVNNKEGAFYRVQYSKTLWKRIADQLSDDHYKIDVLNRAQIADDLFNFARAGNQKITYSEAFTYLDYLNKETDYFPWVSTLNSLNFLLTRVGEDTALGTSLKLKVVDLLEGVYKTLSFEKDDTSWHLYSLKRDLIYNAACKYGSEDCIKNVNALFKTYKETGKVHKNLKKVVYCYGLRNSNDPENDWSFLWGKYQSTKLSTEQVTILGALGCTRNAGSLKKYLELSVTEGSGIRIQDLAAVWKSVYSSSPLGAQVALEYWLENYKAIMEYSKADAPALLSGIASQYITKDQIQKLEMFITMDNLDASYKSAGEASIKIATSNLEWLESVHEDLENYLPVPSTEAPPTTPNGGATSITNSSSLFLILITIIQFILRE